MEAKAVDRPELLAYFRRPDKLGSGAPALSTLPSLPIAYTIGPNGKADYSPTDADAYVVAMKAKAVRRVGGRRRQALTAA
jgi:hypothetical protein